MEIKVELRAFSLSCLQTMDLTPKGARMQEGPTWPWHAADRAFQVMSLFPFPFLCPGGTGGSERGAGGGRWSDVSGSADNSLCDLRSVT